MVTHTRTRIRGIRGATTVDRDDAALMTEATKELLTEILARNALTVDDVISAFFTVTPDLHSEFPAGAARTLGWDSVPMLCGTEMQVSGALGRCIRVLIHVELPDDQHSVRHVYLRDAITLRPDW
jgi:chorismate mutase